MKYLAVLLCLIPSIAWAKKKASFDYQNAVLVRYRTMNAGQHCSGRANGTVSDDGDINANTDSNCYAIHKVHYIVTVGGETLELVPTATKKKFGLAVATMGYSSFFEKDSVLYGQLPSTNIQIRADGGGKFWVKVGKRESLYQLAGVQ